jgi:hypothetical protein
MGRKKRKQTKVNTTPRTFKKFWVFYDQKSMICYTIVFANGDLWACGKKNDITAGFGGNVLEVEGWKNVHEYIKEKRRITRKLGIELTRDCIPEDVIEYVKELSKIHNYGIDNN